MAGLAKGAVAISAVATRALPIPSDLASTEKVVAFAGKDKTAYWANFDWEKAIQTGMDTAGAPFSDKVDFIKTEMMWPITHMLAPAADALSCEEWHRKDDRLEGIEGVYMPGRDSNKLLDMAGWILALLALIGVLVHGAIRIVTRNK